MGLRAGGVRAERLEGRRLLDGVGFAPMVELPLAGQAWSVRSGDLNGDGHVDLLAGAAGKVEVLLGNGRGGFAAARSIDTEAEWYATAQEDVTGDGRLDLVLLRQRDAGVAVMVGKGDGTFAAPVYSTTPSHPESVAVGDVTGDGRPDLVATYSFSQQIDVLPGQGDGTFGAAASLVTNRRPENVVLGDLDRDGHADLVVADGPAGAVGVLLGGGDGTFGEWRSYRAGSRPLYIRLADLNGDDALDLIACEAWNAGLSVLLGMGDGTFAPGVAYSTAQPPTSVAIADYDGDGMMDLAVARGHFLSGGIGLLLGRGGGAFAEEVELSGQPAVGLVAADFNGDGRPDVAFVDSGYRVGVVLNASAGGTPAGCVVLSSALVEENRPAGTVVGTLSVAGAEGEGVWELVSGPGSEANGAFSIHGSDLVLAYSLDYEMDTTHRIRVRRTDGSSRVERMLTINVGDVPGPTFPLESGKTVALTDAQGAEVIRIRLSGPGSGVVDVGDDGYTVEGIDLTGTTDRTVLTITSPQPWGWNVNTIRLSGGSLGAIVAPNITLSGEGIIGGEGSYVRRIRLGTMFDVARISLPGSARSGEMVIDVGYVYGGAQLAFGMPVRLAKFGNFAEAEFRAPRIGTVVTVCVPERQWWGNFDALLTVGGPGISKPLGLVAAEGNVGGTWEIAGDVGAIKAAGTHGNWKLHAAGRVGRVELGGRLAGEIRAAAVTTLKVGGGVNEASVLLGGDGIGTPLRRASVGGTIYGGEWEIAGSVGAITLGEVETFPEVWELHVSGKIGELRTRGRLAGVIRAQAIGRMRVGGAMDTAEVLLGTAGVTEEERVLGSLYVGEAMHNSVLSGWGDLGTISVGALVGATITAGVEAGDDPWTTGALSSTNAIMRVQMRDLADGTSGCDGSRIAAGRIGSVSIFYPEAAMPSAIVAHAVGVFRVKQWIEGEAKVFTWKGKEEAGEVLEAEGIVVRIV